MHMVPDNKRWPATRLPGGKSSTVPRRRLRCYPGGQQYAAAVFTRSQPGADDAAINRAIGAAAARAVAVLHGQ